MLVRLFNECLGYRCAKGEFFLAEAGHGDSCESVYSWHLTEYLLKATYGFIGFDGAALVEQ